MYFCITTSGGIWVETAALRNADSPDSIVSEVAACSWPPICLSSLLTTEADRSASVYCPVTTASAASVCSDLVGDDRESERPPLAPSPMK